MLRETAWEAAREISYSRAVDELDVMLEHSPPAQPEVAAAREPATGRSVHDLLAAGDRRAALGVLMTLHGDTVFGFCVRNLRDRALAEDVQQQVFIEAFRDLGKFEGRSSLRTWLIRIASHRCQDAIKARRRRHQRIEEQETIIDCIDPSPDPTARLERSRLLAALDECLAHLSEEVRMTVLLRFQSGLPYAELSELLEAKADTLHARVSRALPVLKQCLESKGWYDD